MSSYFVTGVSRGIGFEFLQQFSSNPANTVIGLVRNKAATEAKVAEWHRTNVHIVEGDLTDYNSLKAASEATSKITGGSLDYLIANAAMIPQWSAYDGMGALGTKDPVTLEQELVDTFKANIIGNVHLFNLFLPLILKGQAKKVITITTGFADIELTAKYDLELSGPYSVSKAGMNAVVAKYSAEYAKDGVLFLSLSPGVVETGQHNEITEEQAQKAGALMARFASYAPDFKGPSTPEASVQAMISVFEKASVADGYGGAFISHLGTKRWL